MPHRIFPKPWNSVYLAVRIIVWSIFLFGMFRFAFSILFPSRPFFFDFNNSKAQKNTLTSPRTTKGDLRGDGHFGEHETLLVDASVLGEFSDVKVALSEDGGNANVKVGTVSIRRSQQAFFYPEGNLAPFPEGTLLRFGGAFFQIAPEGEWRRFPSEETLRLLGYDSNSFLSVSSEEFFARRDGELVDVSNNEPPDGSFIRSDDTYYAWRNKKLIPFVSKEAFLNSFPENWALPRDASFVRSRTISENWRGYSSGSLLAWGDGVFLMDKESPRPILGVDIFLSLGYSWDDVLPASDEEISLAEKGKFVDISVPHPDGTVLLDTKENRYFLLKGGEKHEIQGETMLHAWLGKRHPILVSSESLTTKASCTLEESSSLFSLFSAASHTCSAPLGNLADFPGDTYEFSLDTSGETNLRRMDVSFESSVKQQTLLMTLSKLKARILSRYISAP